MKSWVLKVFLNLLVGLSIVSALDESSATEMKCLGGLKPDPSFTEEFLNSVPKWYFPMWSKLASYRIAALDLGKSVAEISESDLVNDCESYSPQNSVSTGFHQAGVHITRQFENDGTFTFQADDKNSLKAKNYIVLTDSKEFILGVQCWNDNLASWMVSSKRPILKTENREAIIALLKKLGFDMTKLVEEKYDHCDDTVASVSVESFETYD